MGMNLILRWLLNSLALLAVAYLVPGFMVSGVYAALIAALILGLVNAIIRPVLILFTLPITLLSLGLFTFIINAFMLWLVATIVKGFDIANFSTALLAAIILWLVGFITNALVESTKK